MLTPQDRRKLERQRDALIHELQGIGNLMRGTIVATAVQGGRPGCPCTQGEKHRKVHLSVNLQGRTRHCYLGDARAAGGAPLLAEYARAWRLINDLTAGNLALCRGAHPGGPPRRRALRCARGSGRPRARWSSGPTASPAAPGGRWSWRRGGPSAWTRPSPTTSTSASARAATRRRRRSRPWSGSSRRGAMASTTSASSRRMRGSLASWTGRSPRRIRSATSCTRSMTTS